MSDGSTREDDEAMVTVADLERFATTFADLVEDDVMGAAWRQPDCSTRGDRSNGSD